MENNKVICLNANKYIIENRLAKKEELILTFCDDLNSEYSIFKVHEVIKETDEVVAYPVWYEKGMKCFGRCLILEKDTYEVLKKIS